MRTPTLLEPQPTLEQTVRRWLITEMTVPHPMLGRPGPVCPYLSASLTRDLVFIRSSAWRPTEGGPKDTVTTLLRGVGALLQLRNQRVGRPDVRAVEEVRGVIREAVALFRSRNWPADRPDLRAVVAVLPEMPDAAWPAVDAAHAAAKTRLAEQGLMLGQFHPRCETGAVHNPEFRVLRSPVPLLAVRNMALHDVLFLHSDRHQFAAYKHHFGHRYDQPGAPAALAELYHQAQQRYARWPARRRHSRAPREAA